MTSRSCRRPGTNQTAQVRRTTDPCRQGLGHWSQGRWTRRRLVGLRPRRLRLDAGRPRTRPGYCVRYPGAIRNAAEYVSPAVRTWISSGCSGRIRRAPARYVERRKGAQESMGVLTSASMGGAPLRISRSDAAGSTTPSAAEPRPRTGRVLGTAASWLTSLQGMTASRRRSANAKREPVTDRVSTTTTTMKRSLPTSSHVFSAVHARLEIARRKMLYDQTLLLCDDRPQDTPCALFFSLLAVGFCRAG